MCGDKTFRPGADLSAGKSFFFSRRGPSTIYILYREAENNMEQNFTNLTPQQTLQQLGVNTDGLSRQQAE